MTQPNALTDTCLTCQRTLPVALFKKERRSPKGYTRLCKECHSTKERGRVKSQERKDKDLARLHEWIKNNRDHVAAYMKSATRRRKKRLADTLYRRRNFEKIREHRKQLYRDRSGETVPNHIKQARAKVNDAIRRGEITRDSCSLCGHGTTEAHHHDYAKPLDVTFLCSKHHAAWHKVFFT